MKRGIQVGNHGPAKLVKFFVRFPGRGRPNGWMILIAEAEWLRRYAEQGGERAFAELVRLRVGAKW